MNTWQALALGYGILVAFALGVNHILATADKRLGIGKHSPEPSHVDDWRPTPGAWEIVGKPVQVTIYDDGRTVEFPPLTDPALAIREAAHLLGGEVFLAYLNDGCPVYKRKATA